ncbi:MAG TPA: IS66 family insertion sequence element accessory protein TnpB [Candidatus Avoscillospira stercoripullorum]|uniref:IS66 family insertion sequence element accessory protein TnpB n=1 Tax=Candidatus Avoscillospira stercoripullorum TaxID=2840709 RepID=A0A9D1D6N9_9FIRM|nr:IS66 family insertion sequence element accessory protein TnpB [Candidatus Avoscillospira stercoripullorum]
MIDLSQVRRYYVACGYTDLRRGIDGLAAIVTQQFGAQLNEESLFLFCGRRTDRIKALHWSGDGYLLLYKRLSNGSFQWPRSEAELRELTDSALSKLQAMTGEEFAQLELYPDF